MIGSVQRVGFPLALIPEMSSLHVAASLADVDDDRRYVTGRRVLRAGIDVEEFGLWASLLLLPLPRADSRR